MTRRQDWQWNELILASALVDACDWKSPPRQSASEVIELSQRLRMENPDAAADMRFRSPESVHRKLEDLRTSHSGYAGKPTRGGKLTRQIAQAFADDPGQMRSIATTLLQNPTRSATTELDVASFEAVNSSQVVSAVEGRVQHRIAKHRERDRTLRASKIALHRGTHGDIDCEVCRFSFESTYGKLGAGYVHVHHIVPLHFSGEVTTGMQDLVLVCANCHAMIHRRYPWRDPVELRTIIGTPTYDRRRAPDV